MTYMYVGKDKHILFLLLFLGFAFFSYLRFRDGDMITAGVFLFGSIAELVIYARLTRSDTGDR